MINSSIVFWVRDVNFVWERGANRVPQKYIIVFAKN
jgi:hypothetical protein